MTRKKSTPAPVETEVTLTPERAARLYRLLYLLEAGPKTRSQLEKKLKVGMRTFDRDLEVLRAFEIGVDHKDKKHVLEDPAWKSKLPVPDPNWTFAEAESLANGKSAASKKVADMLAKLTK